MLTATGSILNRLLTNPILTLVGTDYALRKRVF
jgi:hypothetical protein